MKNIIVLGLLILTSVSAKAVWRETGNGGDHKAQEFAANAKEATDILEKLNPPLVKEEVIVKLREAMASTQIYSLESLCKLDVITGKNQCFDALNYPDAKPSRIEVSRTRWLQMNRKDRLAIALHEFLGIIGIEKNTYQISAPFKDALDGSLEKTSANAQKIELSRLENLATGINEEEARNFCARESSVNADHYFYVFCEYDVKSVNSSSKIPHIAHYNFVGYQYSPESDSYFYVFESQNLYSYENRIRLIPVEQEGRSLLSRVRVVGVGPLASAPYKTLVSSLRLDRQKKILLRFSDEITAWLGCMNSLKERQIGSSEWLFDRAECDVAQEDQSNPQSMYYFLIRTQNPYALDNNQ